MHYFKKNMLINFERWIKITEAANFAASVAREIMLTNDLSRLNLWLLSLHRAGPQGCHEGRI